MSNLGHVISLNIAPVHDEYLAIDSGAYLCTNSLCASFADGKMLSRKAEIVLHSRGKM